MPGVPRKHVPYVSGDSNTSSDKFYRGKNRSVINNDFATARRGRPGEPFKQPPVMRFDSTDMSSKKYYEANHGNNHTPAVKKPGAQRQIAGSKSSNNIIQFTDKSKLRLTVTQIITALNTGSPKVYVGVASGLFEILDVQLALAVAREELTPDRRRDVLIGSIKAPDATSVTVKSGPIQDVADNVSGFPPINPDAVPLGDPRLNQDMSEEEMRALIESEEPEEQPEEQPEEAEKSEAEEAVASVNPANTDETGPVPEKSIEQKASDELKEEEDDFD